MNTDYNLVYYETLNAEKLMKQPGNEATKMYEYEIKQNSILVETLFDVKPVRSKFSFSFLASSNRIISLYYFNKDKNTY